MTYHRLRFTARRYTTISEQEAKEVFIFVNELEAANADELDRLAKKDGPKVIYSTITEGDKRLIGYCLAILKRSRKGKEVADRWQDEFDEKIAKLRTFKK